MSNTSMETYVLPFGKYKGCMLEEVPLEYLDNVLHRGWAEDVARRNIKAYLNDVDVKKDLADEIKDKLRDKSLGDMYNE